MIERPNAHISFLLQLWYIDNDGNPVWRFSLESPKGNEKFRFTDLADLVKFIQTCISTHEQESEDTAKKGTGGENEPKNTTP